MKILRDDIKLNKQIIAVVFYLMFTSIFLGQQNAELLKREAERHMKAGRFGEAINMLNVFIEQKPEIYDGYYLRGQCYEKRSQLKSAIEDLQKANELKSNDNQLIKYLSELKTKYKLRLNEEIKKLEKELTINPRLFNHYVSLLELYIENGAKSNIQELHDKFIKLNNVPPSTILRYGEMLAKYNMLNDGLEILEHYSNIYTNDKMLNSRLGYFNLWLGNFQTAENIFKDVLLIDPNLNEAKEGFKQAKAKGYFVESNNGETAKRNTSYNRKLESKIEMYKKSLLRNPKDYKTRILMVDELLKKNRLEESYDQLQIVINDTINIPRISLYRNRLTAKSDSIFKMMIFNFQSQLDKDQNRKDVIEKMSFYYGLRGDYKNAMNVLEKYFNREDIFEADEFRFKYAQYASWDGNFDEALKQMNYLLTVEPNNLEYQLLKAKVLVWSDKNLIQAEKYLLNNLSNGNQSIEVILNLATLYIQDDKPEESKKYIDWAKKIDPLNAGIEKTELLYFNYQKALKEKRIYSLIEAGRKFVTKGKCDQAYAKFDEYFSLVKNPTDSELIEFADICNCLQKYNEANLIYSRILEKEYKTDVALLRAKNLLWSKDYKKALADLKLITAKNPSNYEAKALLGEAYQNLKQHSMAENIYKNVLSESDNETINEMVKERMSYLPKTGFVSLFSNFPRPIGVLPAVINYTDNQNFAMNDFGGRLEIGIMKYITGGVSYSDILLYSYDDKKKFTRFKGHLYIHLFESLQLSGSYGVLNSPSKKMKNIGSISLQYNVKDVLDTEIYYENNFASMILYSPFLVNQLHTVDFLKFRGSYKHSKKIQLSGYFNYLNISDGNIGNDFLFRIGSELLEDAVFGYESRLINYKYDSPFVPFSNQSQRLYYSPQNLESHSIWTEWELEQSSSLKFKFGGKIGYIPLYDIVLREIESKINYIPLNNFIINLTASAGNSYRFDSSYQFFSGILSVYWKVF